MKSTFMTFRYTITQQYLEHLELMEELNLNIAAEFIMMAVQLVETKIRMLLPKPAVEEGIEAEDLRRPLVEQLLEYQKIKMAAQLLKDKESAGRRTGPDLERRSGR
jgi:segregation and condensation protein A